MPIEIMQMIVRAEIREDSPSTAPATSNQPSTAPGADTSGEVAEKIIELIKRKKER